MAEYNFKDYENTYKAISKGLSHWERIKDDKDHDKKGLAFSLTGNIIELESWDGVYGNSSCYPFFSVGNKVLFTTTVLKVLNKNKISILEEMIDVLRQESEHLKEEEIETLELRLKELKGK